MKKSNVPIVEGRVRHKLIVGIIKNCIECGYYMERNCYHALIRPRPRETGPGNIPWWCKLQSVDPENVEESLCR